MKWSGVKKILKRALRSIIGTYRGSNRVSLVVRKRIENVPFSQIIGINLASMAFLAAVTIPQSSTALATVEVARETQYTVVDVVPTETVYQWPLTQFGISQRFSVTHPALDLTSPVGTEIKPVANGTVRQVTSSSWGYGKHIILTHKDDTASLYAHLSTISVTAGQEVTKDAIIGLVGMSGWSSGSHLHLEIYQQNTPLNPLEVLPSLH